ncbi:MAG: cyclic nucleotide-binding domain-containing protein [Desulfamplus sp.]|nr:cyclic nucleotide-binding domain-containing protein [Desulfamplus sp.]
MDSLIKQESLVEKYISENKIEQAVKILFDLSVHYAKKRDFVKAEALRDRLIEINSLALTEIITSGEIIDEQKQGAISQDSLQLWQPLFSTLTTEEANALYSAMEEEIYFPDQIIFKQGEPNSNLYFIKRGQVKIVYLQNNKETLLKLLEAGNIAGDDSFFPITVCTTSMISLTGTKIDTISRASFQRWETSLPSLSSKLKDFCLKSKEGSIVDLIKQKGLERRVYQRVNVSGQVMVMLVGADDKAIGKPFRGNLSDISAAGVSFYITTKKETARLLLGRDIAIKFVLRDESRKIIKKGTVVSVGYNLFNDYSIHVDFEKDMSKATLHDIIENIVKSPDDKTFK